MDRFGAETTALVARTPVPVICPPERGWYTLVEEFFGCVGERKRPMVRVRCRCGTEAVMARSVWCSSSSAPRSCQPCSRKRKHWVSNSAVKP